MTRLAGVRLAPSPHVLCLLLFPDAKRRRFDVVLVWKLDRFGRFLRHLVNALAEFESLGIAFVSLSDNLDLSTASGRLMFNIIGAMAEFERELIRERVKAGMKNAQAKGARIGRPRTNVDTARIVALRTAGLSWRAIETELGVSVRTARRFMSACGKNVSSSASASLEYSATDQTDLNAAMRLGFATLLSLSSLPKGTFTKRRPYSQLALRLALVTKLGYKRWPLFVAGST